MQSGRKAFDGSSDWNLRFQISPASVDGNHLTRFQSKTSDFKFLWCSLEEKRLMGPQIEISAFKFLRPVWTEIIWRVFRVKASFSNFSGVVCTVRHTSKCDSFISFPVKGLEMCSQMLKGLNRAFNSILVMNSYCTYDILTLKTPQFMWQIWCGKAVIVFLSFVLLSVRGTGASFKRNHQHHWQLGGLCCGSHGKRSVRQRKWKLNHSTPDAFLLVWITSTL